MVVVLAEARERSLTVATGPPNPRHSFIKHRQDTRAQRRRGLDCAQEDSGDSARERGARGAQLHSQYWRQAGDEEID
jgi:hypothetical protein